MTTLKLPQLPWHGTKELEIDLPDSWQVQVCNMAGYDRPALNDDEIKAAIANPIGTPHIREMAKDRKQVVIIFDDMSRPTRIAKIVPPLLEELAQAGIPDRTIRFVAGSGTHGAMNRSDFVKKLGENVLTRFPVFNHNIYENCTPVGTTSSGTEVLINAEVMNCDFKIAINVTTPHRGAGFSGCAKMIVPGVAALQTTMANHAGSVILKQATPHNDAPRVGDSPRPGVNPMYADMEEAAELAGLDFAIECIVNQWGETVALYSGAMRAAHEASVREARTHYLTPKAENADIVIANTYAKVNEAFLGAKASVSVRNGGDLVLIANAPDGGCVHYLGGAWGNTFDHRGRGRFPIPPNLNRLIVYSEYPDIAFWGVVEESPKLILLNKWEDVSRTLQVHGNSATVAVYPSADILYFG